jgi:hypothetical protein
MRWLITGFICLLFHGVITAQISKGYQALHNYDFFKAKKIFISCVNKHPVSANYGLALIFTDSLNHFHSLDSAYRRLMAAGDAYKLITPEKQLRYRKYGINDSAITALHDHICRIAFHRTSITNSFEAYQHFLKIYTGATQKPDAIALRNARAFEKALKDGSASALSSFIEQFSEAIEVPMAMDRLDEALFREETAGGRLEDFERFLQKYTASRHTPEAENAIYSLSVNNESTDELYAFVKRFPSNRNTPAAWNLLYDKFTSDQRRESIAAFKERFPEYPYQERVNRDFELTGIRLFPVIRENKWGYCDSTGRILIHYQFDEAGHFSENMAPVKINGRSGYINKAGQKVIAPAFSEAYSFQQGLAIVETDSLSGLINTAGDWIIKPCPATIEGPFGHLYRLSDDSGINFYNALNGKMMNEKYESSGDFSEGLCAVISNGLTGFIDTAGRLVIATQFQEAMNFDNNYAIVRQNNLSGLINRAGEYILPCRFDGIGSVSEDYVKVYQNGKCAFFDLKGKLRLPFSNDYVFSDGKFDGYKEGFTRIRKKGKSGFANKKGQVVIQPMFDQVLDFSEGLAGFRKKGKWGYIDHKGKVVIPSDFDNAENFLLGIARVFKAGNWGLIDKAGKVILPFEFEAIQRLNNYMLVTRKGKKTLMNLSLNQLIADFDEIKPSVEKNIFEVYQKGKFAYYHALTDLLFWKEDGF